MTLNPVQLRTFVEVAVCGSFAAAARRLGYTAAAVSQQISMLERDTGLQLFARTNRTVQLTSEGATLLPEVRRALTELDRLADASSALVGGHAGRLVIGSFPTAITRLAAPALARFARFSPNVEILLHEGEPDKLVPDVETRRIDLAIAYQYGPCPVRWPEDLNVSPLLDEALLLLLPETRPSARTQPDLAELAGERWISTRDGTSGATALERITATEGYEPKVAFRTNDYAAIRSFVSCGLGAAILPALAWTPTPGVVHIPLPGAQAFRRVVTLHRRVGACPVVEPALQAVRQTAARLVADDPLLSFPYTGRPAGGRHAPARNEPLANIKEP